MVEYIEIILINDGSTDGSLLILEEYAQKDNRIKIVNKENNDVLTTGFDSIKQILANQENAVIFVKDNKYGVMNLSGEILIDAQYDDLLETKVGTLINSSIVST